MPRQKGKIIILSGPSGSGKTTLYKRILSTTSKLVKTISVTTREPRPGERQGHDYFFVTQKQFFYKRKAGHFLESQKVFDNYYGTPKKQVKDFLKKGRNVLLCIDVKGAKIVRRTFPEAITIFIKSPSLRELKKRLQQRGSESLRCIQLRLKTAREELKESINYNYIIVNDNLSKTNRKLRALIQSIV